MNLGDERDSARPPRWAERILEGLVASDERDELVGDLHERFRGVCRGRGVPAGRRWYLRQVLSAAPRLLVAGVLEPGRGATQRHLTALSPAALAHEFSHAVRIVWREPGFTLTAVLILGLGIGATTTMFSIGSGILSNLPVAEPDEVVAVRWLDPRGDSNVRLTLDELATLTRSQTTFEALAGYRAVDLQLSSPEARPDRRSGALLSPKVFEILGTRPVLGRLFTDDDTRPGAPPALLIGEGIWRDRYGSAPDVVGRVVRVNEVQRTIVGVLPGDFGFPKHQEAWAPLPTAEDGEVRGVEIVGRLNDGVTLEAARSELSTLGEALAGAREGAQDGLVLDVSAFVEVYVGPSDRMMMLTMIMAVTFVLLIASANVANLLLSRAVLRSKEVALRLALGSGRGRIVFQLLMESLVLAALGGLVGVGLTMVGVGWFARALGDTVLIWWMVIEVNQKALLWASGCVGAATLIAGLAPALQASAVDLQRAMKSESAGSSDGRYSRVGKVLVVGQLSLSCALLILSMLMVRGVTAKSMAHPGFEPEGVMTGTILLGAFDYPDELARQAFLATLDARLTTIVGAKNVSLMSDLPSTPGTVTRIRRRGAAEDDPGVRTAVRWVSPSFFDFFRMTPQEGRLFDPRDEAAGLAVGVANQALIDALGGTAAGTSLAWVSSAARTRPEPVIVGMVDDPDVSVLDGRRIPGLFLPIWDMPFGEVRVGLRRDPLSGLDLGASIMESVADLDPNLPVRDLAWLEDELAERIVAERAFAILFAMFGFAATLLASVGLYGVVAFNVNRRVREFGIRRALGASPRALLSRVIREGVPVLALGLGVGIVLGFTLAPGMGGGLSGADPHDPLTFIAVPSLLALVSAVALFLPGRRAVRIEPMTALRSE